MCTARIRRADTFAYIKGLAGVFIIRHSFISNQMLDKTEQFSYSDTFCPLTKEPIMTLDEVLAYIDNASLEELVIIRQRVEQARTEKNDDAAFEPIKRQADECIGRMLSSDRRLERTWVRLNPAAVGLGYVERLIRHVQSDGTFTARAADSGPYDVDVIIEWK